MYVKLMEVGETFNYIRRNDLLMKVYVEIDSEMRKLVEKYSNVLLESEKCKAYSIFWGARSVEEYRDRFLTWVLIYTYNVFDKTHVRYLSVLKAIKENNPEWVSAFENAHKRKLASCKVSVYSLEEALTV